MLCSTWRNNIHELEGCSITVYGLFIFLKSKCAFRQREGLLDRCGTRVWGCSRASFRENCCCWVARMMVSQEYWTKDRGIKTYADISVLGGIMWMGEWRYVVGFEKLLYRDCRRVLNERDRAYDVSSDLSINSNWPRTLFWPATFPFDYPEFGQWKK